MSKYKEHCEKSKEIFGEEGKEYHAWIDQFAKFGYHHRQVLHNVEGMEIGVQIFGERARQHLKQHILDDYKSNRVPTIRNLRNEGRTNHPLGIKKFKWTDTEVEIDGKMMKGIKMEETK